MSRIAGDVNGSAMRPARPALVRLVDVTKTYRTGEVETHVLRGINLEIGDGELLVVIGPSGSGKSTLLNIVGGVDRPTSGEVWFEGRELGAMTDAQLTRFRRDHLGFIFQFYNLVPTLTALENVEISAQIAADPMDAREALAMVGLADRADHFPSQLSGGEQQRVAVARALAKNPRLLLCDEPTGALDYATGKPVLEVLVRLNERLGTTIVIITHNVPIGRMADRVIHLGSGTIVETIVNERRARVEEISW